MLERICKAVGTVCEWLVGIGLATLLAGFLWEWAKFASGGN